MNKKIKRYLSVLVLVLLLLGVTVGYSILTQRLDITGTSKINNATWNIHFENVSVTPGSVTNATAPTATGTDTVAMSYTANLEKPGDFYEFTFDVKNGGSVDAKLSAIPTLSGVSTAQAVYTNYTITHANGSPVVANEEIAAGANDSFKVRVEFKKDITASQLPTSAQNLNLTVAMNYVQK